MAGKLAYSVAEAAEVLGLSEWSVRQAVKRGALPVVPAAIAGSRTLIPVAALGAHITATAQAAS